MKLVRIRVLLIGVAGLVFLSPATLGSQPQVRPITDKVLEDAGQGTEWTDHRDDWSEQRYSTDDPDHPGERRQARARVVV